MISRILSAAAALTLVGAAPQTAPATVKAPAAWTTPTSPFRIADNLYYVGTKGLASYLIVTARGLILLDATMEENVPGIEENIRSLGYKLSDVKILLNSHAHFDHAGGLAKMKRDTGATLMAMKADVWALENGKHFGDQNYVASFAPVKVDRVLTDGAKVELGGVTMTAIATPGHTAGCTTWMMPVTMKGIGAKTAVFPCSLTVAGNRLVGNRQYPGIVADYQRSFTRMAKIRADLVLPAHPEMADVLTRKGTGWLAPDLLPKLIAEQRAAFEAELRKQQAAAK